MAYTATELWEAFTSGEGWGGQVYSDIDPGYTDYEQRTKDFYSGVIGPAFGAGEDFGTTGGWTDYIAAFEPESMERAEEAFRMSIGDPYGATAERTGDPFAWERISRYQDPDSAQRLLEDQLHEYGEQLGGIIGADYGTGMSKELKSYTSGLESQREGLSYTKLSGEQGLVSGTSGSVLRSGEGVSQAEDVLVEAYKKSKSLGTGYEEGKEGIELDLKGNLDNALTTYLAAIDDEKNAWYNSVLHDVARKSGDVSGATVGTGEGTLFSSEQWQCGYGQEYKATQENNFQGGCVDTEDYDQELAGYEFRESGACGVGELWIPDDSEAGGSCQSEFDFEYFKYGEGSGYTSDDDIPIDTSEDTTVQCPPGSLGPDGTGQATGQHIYDYSNCTTIDDPNACADGSAPNWLGVCPEDGGLDEGEIGADPCECQQYSSTNSKSGEVMYEARWNCLGHPRHNTLCSGGGDNEIETTGQQGMGA